MKKQLRIFAAILAGIMLFAMAACSSTPKALDAIKKNGKLVISLEGGFEPFEYYEGSKIVGIDIDIAEYIAEKWEVELEIQDMDFNAALTAVATGVVDLSMSGISRTEEREKNMSFSNAYFDSSQLIVVRTDSDIKSKDDLLGKKVGAQAGTTGEEMAIEFVGEANVIGYGKYVMAVQDLKNGQIDAIIMDAFPAKSNVKANEGEILALEEPLGKDEYCIAIKKDNNELVDEVNKILDEMSKNGKLDEIINKYSSVLEG